MKHVLCLFTLLLSSATAHAVALDFNDISCNAANGVKITYSGSADLTDQVDTTLNGFNQTYYLDYTQSPGSVHLGLSLVPHASYYDYEIYLKGDAPMYKESHLEGVIGKTGYGFVPYFETVLPLPAGFAPIANITCDIAR